MRIEKESIHLGSLNLEQVRISGQVIGLSTKKNYALKKYQFEMLNLMEKGFSIDGIIQHFLGKKILISFNEFRTLIQFLISEDLLLNDGWSDYFNESLPEQNKDEGILTKIKSIFTPGEKETSTDIKEELKKIPFLRSLHPDVLNTMLKEMRTIETPAGIAVCQEGQLQRSLFVMIKGQAAVIKKKGYAKPRKVATITDGAVFGEVGFFLGEPRTADVITEKPSQIIRLKYQPEVFDQLIEKEAAKNLQKRFWVIHSLLKSKTFSAIPDDCFDALVFAGNVKNFPSETTVFKQGDEGDSCYVIVQGSVVVVKDQKTVNVLGQGDSFGEVALMVNNGKRSATVKTQTETTVLEIPIEKFYQLLGNNLVLGCEFEKIAINYMKTDLAKSLE